MVKDLAKQAAKTLKLGKASGPPVYSLKHPGLCAVMNHREKEALDLNYGALWVTGLSWFSLSISTHHLESRVQRSSVVQVKVVAGSIHTYIPYMIMIYHIII